MKVAITGATGFIGSLLVKKHIGLGDEVHVLTRKKINAFSQTKNVHLHIGDLSDNNVLERFLNNIDVLYHCAAEVQDESKMRGTNVLGTKNLLSVARDNVKHWVQLSSVGVYGPLLQGIVTEHMDYNPINEYEKTKLQSDIMVTENALQHGFSFTVIRPSNVFGKFMVNESLFKIINAIQKGLFFFIGRKGASANYVPVENVIEALYLGAIHPAGKNEIYIISNWIAIEDFIGYIANALKISPRKTRVSKNLMIVLAKVTSLIPGNPLTVARINALSNRVVYSTDKIERELGYQPIVDMEDAIKKLVTFYQESN